MPWTETDIPDLTDRTIVVTGANSGIGLEAARMFAEHGARVVMACRTVSKGEAAAAYIRKTAPSARLEVMGLDLADLDSVRSFAAGLRSLHGELHALVNNAGVMALPHARTAQGFEMQLGTNHFGHFALTGLLLESLAPSARIVNVSSAVHRIGTFDWTDLNWERSYSAWGAYARSKLANLYFTFELDRRLKAAGSPLISVACHPGYAATNLQHVGPQQRNSSLESTAMSLGNAIFAQSARSGALPTAYATVAEGLRGAEYVGPRIFQAWGAPVPQSTAARAQDKDAWKKLWEASEKRTAVRFL